MAENITLVTGGAGFIGRHLVDQLLQRGDRVRVLDTAEALDMGPDVEVVMGSILDSGMVRRSLKGVGRLYHLAANPNLWARRKADFQEANLEGTRIVLSEARRRDLERIVYTSTETILRGNLSDRSRAGGREAEPTVDDMPGPYCRSKFLAEKAALEAARDGLPLVVVNPTMPVGPGDRLLTPPTKMLVTFLNGKAPAYFNCQFNLIDVRDVALGHILAADKGRIGERYLLGGENISLRRLLAMLHEITGLPMPKIRVPYWLTYAVGTVSEFVADHITGKPPMAPLTGVRLARTPMTYDCSKAIEELGLPQRPIRQALADAVMWLDEQGHLDRRAEHMWATASD